MSDPDEDDEELDEDDPDYPLLYDPDEEPEE